MTVDDIKAGTRLFLAQFLCDTDIDDDTDLFDAGLINSLFAMQLILFIEQEFGITIENDDLEYDNFNTLTAIAGLVQGKYARP